VVLGGQVLERPALVACGDLTLEGLFHRGRRSPALLVCPPLDGGGMDAAAVAELAWASARAGHPSLRFQHRGLGASQGEPDPALTVADAAAALDHLAEGGPAAIALAGVASGCATALALAASLTKTARASRSSRPRHLAGLALVGPPALKAASLKGWAGPLLLVLPEKGRAPRRDALAAGARVERVAGADAAFRRGLPGVGHAVVEWLAALDRGA
jgi:pimeloyl-ACP methyl ester carboxylesterase